MNLEFPRPDIDSEEYHDYYRNMMIIILCIYQNHQVQKYIVDNEINKYYYINGSEN